MVTAPDYEEMSWELSVQIDPKSGDESMKFKLRVKGDLHIGGLMLKLVEKISKCLGILQMKPDSQTGPHKLPSGWLFVNL